MTSPIMKKRIKTTFTVWLIFDLQFCAFFACKYCKKKLKKSENWKRCKFSEDDEILVVNFENKISSDINVSWQLITWYLSKRQESYPWQTWLSTIQVCSWQFGPRRVDRLVKFMYVGCSDCQVVSTLTFHFDDVSLNLLNCLKEENKRKRYK